MVHTKNTYIWIVVSISKSNIEITKLLIDYANKNNLLLNINEKDKDRNYPLLLILINNNKDGYLYIMLPISIF
ncbi:hypothetical protein BCR32DRAFT_284430 [Anaeromyces robustus]|uniref:Ankyrin n=1 Tax=Anaeromyces robustus TaxID=1754192 RepID=A0A1Y1WRL5_9FUNG|nr:hypothetical protein BCR32DRAFT_284430 [Anaeromyces robustus]|eukprot:ORX76179.1 hypothetical protein BCR32DRAFT_284430 [Anaeromyces robustus]